jgi:chorismate mutase/prephenate dehydratase
VSAGNENTPGVGELREGIDRIDRELVELINRRIELAERIGELKKREGAAIYVPSREEQVFARVREYNRGLVSEGTLERIFREIISASIAREQPLRIAFLGPRATFTHQAAMKNFGSSAEFIPFPTIGDVFRAVERKEGDYGVVPIENSTEGAVFHSLDTFVESNLKIVAQVYLPIEHCLISDGTLETVKCVYSKDQALGQCREGLRALLPEARLVEVDSTAQAIQRVAGQPGEAAVGSALAAELYGVGILKRGIQDRHDNTTRFLVLGERLPPRDPACRYRSSLMVSIPDQVGALKVVVDHFSERGINLVKIESRPSRQRAWDYLFFIDFLGHGEDPRIKEVLEQLKSRCPLVKWLGSYPETKTS